MVFFGVSGHDSCESRGQMRKYDRFDWINPVDHVPEKSTTAERGFDIDIVNHEFGLENLDGYPADNHPGLVLMVDHDDCG